MASRIRRNYCLDCEWFASIDCHGRRELVRLAIERATEYGHDIESVPA